MRIDFDKWFHEKGEPSDWLRDPALDEKSESSRFRHSSWAKIRKMVWDGLTRTSQTPSRRRAFGECGTYSWIEQSSTDADKFRVRHNHCHDRLCTPCANARSREIHLALMAQIAGKPVSFITLTLCGRKESLRDLIDRLYRHFRALRLHPTWAEKVRGGAAFLEIKWSDKAQRWHPHLHIIADADFIPQSELSDVWRGISKDSFIVDIRRVKEVGTIASYVTKYASKPLNMSFTNTAALLDEAIMALKGRRLCLCFGSWFGTPLSDAEDEGLLEEPPSSDWKVFSDLETVLHRARGGERDAIRVLSLAGAETRWRMSLEDTS